MKPNHVLILIKKINDWFHMHIQLFWINCSSDEFIETFNIEYDHCLYSTVDHWLLLCISYQDDVLYNIMLIELCNNYICLVVVAGQQCSTAFGPKTSEMISVDGSPICSLFTDNPTRRVWTFSVISWHAMSDIISLKTVFELSNFIHRFLRSWSS